MDIKVVVKPPFSKVGNAIGSVNINSFLRAKINEIAASVERFGKQLSPVDTGRLRASIHFSPASTFLKSIVSTDTDYAIFVHEGTRYMRARPFMGTGAEKAVQYIQGEIGRSLEASFARAFKTL